MYSHPAVYVCLSTCLYMFSVQCVCVCLCVLPTGFYDPQPALVKTSLVILSKSENKGDHGIFILHTFLLPSEKGNSHLLTLSHSFFFFFLSFLFLSFFFLSLCLPLSQSLSQLVCKLSLGVVCPVRTSNLSVATATSDLTEDDWATCARCLVAKRDGRQLGGWSVCVCVCVFGVEVRYAFPKMCASVLTTHPTSPPPSTPPHLL